MLAAAAACTRQETDSPRMVEWSFDAVATKAGLDQQGRFSWDAGDRIAVWNATSGAFVSFRNPAGSARFSASAPSDAHFTDCAFYPADQVVSAAAVTLPASYSGAEEAARAFPMHAMVEEGSTLLSFRHLGALLTVPLVLLPDGAAILEIGSPSHGLSGTFALTDTAPRRIEAIAGSGAVRISIPADALSLTVTLPVPVGSYPLSIRVLDAAETELFAVEGTEAISFQRACQYILDIINASAVHPISVVQTEMLEIQSDSGAWSHE